MLLVIVGHQEKIDVLYYLLNPVKVPLFFMVSGYVFNDKRTSVTEFIRKIMTGIVVPWMFMAVVSLLCYAPFNGGLKYFLNAFKNTLLGVSFWYIPCCIASMVLWFFTRKFFRKTAYTCIAAVVCFAAGLAAAHYQVLDEFMINRALICQLYMLLGFLFRKNEERISRIKWPYVAGCVVAYLAAAVLGMLVTPRPFIDVHLNIYDNMPYSFALIVLGGFALFAVSIVF